MKLFTRTKKGSLSLSMEAIVILILAVTMLGLGLTFVRNIFSDLSGKVDQAVNVETLHAQPNEDKPVVVSPPEPEIKEGRTFTVNVGFYNPSTTNEKWFLKVLDSTSDFSGTGTGTGTAAYGNPCGSNNASGGRLCDGVIGVKYTHKAFKLEKDQTTAYSLIIKPESGSVPTGEAVETYLLSVVICSEESTTTGGTTVSSNDCGDSSEMFQKEIVLKVRS